LSKFTSFQYTYKMPFWKLDLKKLKDNPIFECF
jgi:hypothetical protein